MLRLCHQFEGRLTLEPGEWEDDALAGASAVALKRASLFGRAPVVHDLRLALALFGFLGDAPEDLVELRRHLFEGVAHPHHYVEQRRIADLVPDETLRMSPEEVAERVQGVWRELLADHPDDASAAHEARPSAKKAVKRTEQSTTAGPEVSETTEPSSPNSGESAAPGTERPSQAEAGSIFGRSSDVGERKKKSPSQAWLKLRKDV